MKTFKQFISEEELPSVGINVNNDDVPYADHIVDGKKKYETRRKPTLNKFIGQKVGIIRTSKKGKAKAIGHATVGEPIKVGYEEFDKMRHEHLVPKGSTHDCAEDGHKWLYPMEHPKRWDTEKDVINKGSIYISREIKH